MFKTKASVLWVLPLLAACQAEAPANGKDDTGSVLSVPTAPEATAVTFSCESGTELQLTVDGARTLHLKYGDQTLNLQGEAVNTGASYRNAEYRWGVIRKGDIEEGTLYRGGEPIEICIRQQRSAAPTPGMAPCRADQLELRSGESDAGMGHRQQTFEVALKGRQACLLPAWPSIHLEGFGTQAPPEVHRTTDSYFGPQAMSDRVTLTPERPVMFQVGWSVIPDESKGQTTCPTVTGMVVSAPGGGALAPVAQNYKACGRGVEISPYRPSTQERQKIN